MPGTGGNGAGPVRQPVRRYCLLPNAPGLDAGNPGLIRNMEDRMRDSTICTLYLCCSTAVIPSPGRSVAGESRISQSSQILVSGCPVRLVFANILSRISHLAPDRVPDRLPDTARKCPVPVARRRHGPAGFLKYAEMNSVSARLATISECRSEFWSVRQESS